eukprot:GFYU01001471.1.p1 GENE.GFYU01001471.1~~GFYU01001471.1.p1  ORF type:complete len:321 (-),score=64.82 GFYU01001471.1:131-961(-)
MLFEVLYPGPTSALRVQLQRGEVLKAEPGAMVTMSENIDLESARMEGGIWSGLARVGLLGESLFIQTFKATYDKGEVLLAPNSSAGEIYILEMTGTEELYIQRGGFVACSEGIQLSTKFQDVSKGLFSGEGFALIRATGRGQLAISSYGAVHRETLQPGQNLIVDNHHLLAYSSSADYTIEKASKTWTTTLLSGEGFVLRFKAISETPAEVFIATRQRPIIRADGRQQVHGNSSAGGIVGIAFCCIFFMVFLMIAAAIVAEVLSSGSTPNWQNWDD